MFESLIAQIHAGSQRARRPFAGDIARQVGEVQRGLSGLGFGAGKRQQLMYQVGAALRAGQHFGQTLLQGGLSGLTLGQFHLADEAGQRRAQLVRGIVQKPLFLLHAARHLPQQAIDGLHQRMHFAGGLLHFDG